MLRILLLMVVLFSSQLGFAASYTVEISEQQLQDNLSAMLPIEQKTFYETVELSGAEIDLDNESDKINATITMQVHLPGDIKSEGQGSIVGGLRYDSSEGAFYLNRLYLISIELGSELESKKRSIKTATQLAVTKGLPMKPVYILKDDKKKQQLAKATIDSMIVKGDKILVTFTTL